MSSSLEPGANSIFLNVAVDPGDANRIYVSDARRVYRTQDGGGEWKIAALASPEG